MSDHLPTVRTEDARRIAGTDYEPSGRMILDEPLEPDGFPITGYALERAADLMNDSLEGRYQPAIVNLISDDEEKARDKYPTLALVNEEHPDDVIVIAPVVRETQESEVSI